MQLDERHKPGQASPFPQQVSPSGRHSIQIPFGVVPPGQVWMGAGGDVLGGGDEVGVGWQLSAFND